jgi:hypothetical protein
MVCGYDLIVLIDVGSTCMSYHKGQWCKTQNDTHAHRGENVVNISSWFRREKRGRKLGTWAYVKKFSGEWW